MHINDDGLKIIMHFEGFRSEPYTCPAGVWTIGYGSTFLLDGSRVTSVTPSVTKSEAMDLLRGTLGKYERAVGRLINVELNDNQFSALVSFTYNLGQGSLESSTLRRKLNDGDYEGAANEFPRWNKSNGVVLKGLVLRREAEKELFLS